MMDALGDWSMRYDPRVFIPCPYTMIKIGCCGIAIMRSELASSFNIFRSENDLVKLVDKFYMRQGLPDRVGNPGPTGGVTPSAFSHTIKRVIRQELKEDVYVACSKRGDLARLDLLLNEFRVIPALHRVLSKTSHGVHEDEGHYFLYGGSQPHPSTGNRVVNYFDVGRTGGWRQMHERPFLDMWSRRSDEQWYLAVIPKGERGERALRVLGSVRFL